MRYCKAFSILWILLLLFLKTNGQSSFYDESKIQEIKIIFPFTNWDYRMDTAKAGKEDYILATSCTINGQVFDSVGVKYKGNSSYRATNAKNPLHIELDWVKGNQDYKGFSDIKLGNGFSDPSSIREVLSYKILRHYMHAPQSNFARIFINGAYYGLMTSSEHIGKKFVGEHFYSTGNTLVKCNPAVAGPGGSNSSLEYTGSDSTTYLTRYEIKSETGWQDLIDLCNTLQNNSSAISQKLDVDRALWMLAYNIALVNLDSYQGAFAQNYYLYKDNEGLFNSIVWDLNMSFGGFKSLGTGGPGGGQLTVAQMQTLSPTTQSTNAARPLVNKLLAVPRYKKIYIAHMKTIINEFFANGAYMPMAQSLQAIIDSSVNVDPNDFYTYAQFQSSLTTNIGSAQNQSPGIQPLMTARVSYLNSTPEFQAVAPVISTPVVFPVLPIINETTHITAQVGGATAVILGYRNEASSHFIKIDMLDDGLHQDGAAGDGVYGASFIPQTGLFQYYVYSENANAGIFSPVRAEHEFYSKVVRIPTVEPGQVVINEFLAINQTGVIDEQGANEDWIELYNTTDSTQKLFGLFASDDKSLLTKWGFPDNTNLAPHGYLTIWADNDTSSQSLHANFKISGSGETLYISNSEGLIIDSVKFGQQTADISFGRCGNGIGPFVQNAFPTFGTENICLIPVSGLKQKQEEVLVFPMPSSGIVTVQYSPGLQSVAIYSILGKKVFEEAIPNLVRTNLDITGIRSGQYLMVVNGNLRRKITFE